MKRIKNKLLIIILIILLVGPTIVLFRHEVDFKSHWSNADRTSANLAPDPKTNPEAVVQIYAARTYNWRGLFAVHTWIALKPKNADQYLVYQVIGWRKYWHLPVYEKEHDIPDRIWFGNKPWLLKEIRGNAAEILIPKVQAAIAAYPYKETYYYWPGPNSNTFTAFVGRAVPELHLALPSIAIGKDYLGFWRIFAKAPSNTGYQFSLLGMLGILIAQKEGIEINIFGMVYGISFKPFGIIIPGLGKITL